MAYDGLPFKTGSCRDEFFYSNGISRLSKTKKFSVLSVPRAKRVVKILLDINNLTGQIIGAAIEVHKALGPGLLESAYEECICRELSLRDIPFERQKEVPVEYKGCKLDCGYRLDLVVKNLVIVELKAVERIEPIGRISKK